ncbi:hypothetical protein G6F63_016002 [Rhizopus arrhizus]|nr:hypothetical protein G6F63_016002 [Rhizopus arrhizus]
METTHAPFERRPGTDPRSDAAGRFACHCHGYRPTHFHGGVCRGRGQPHLHAEAGACGGVFNGTGHGRRYVAAVSPAGAVGGPAG